MNFTDVTLSYPWVHYKVKVSHYTERKSTAIEWIILEAISKCEKLPQYNSIAISTFFEQIFAISDADLLIRPVLISLQDLGAIKISAIDDETELNTVAMSNLKLTKTGQEMQTRGLLPGTTTEEAIALYFDIVSKAIKDEAYLKEESMGIRVVDIEDLENIYFPQREISEWLVSAQCDKIRTKLSWLMTTTKIASIDKLESKVYWKNVTRKVELVKGMNWKVSGVEEDNINEITLEGLDIPCIDDMKDLTYLEIIDSDSEAKKLVPIADVNSLIGEFLQKDDLFCVDSKYYKDVKVNTHGRKQIRIGIIYGAEKFEVESKGKQIIIRIPESEFKNQGIYFNSKECVQAGLVTVKAGTISRDIAIAYIPKTCELSLRDIVIYLVEEYYIQDNTILFVLYELGLKEVFLQYVARIISEQTGIADKDKVIESFNEKSRGYYGQNIISTSDREKLLVNENYIIEKCKTIEDAKNIIEEYAEINAFRQDESILQRIIKLVIENVGEQDSLDDIWNFLKTISSVDKVHINLITKPKLYKGLYSPKSIISFIDRFTDEDILKIKEYTVVEQIILNMRRISLEIERMLPELNVFETVSNEKCNELVISHRDIIETLYEQVRKWQDEEECFNNQIIELDKIIVPSKPFANLRENIFGLRNALATFFDDSFIRFNKVYIVDTCTLMNEPGLISWFDDKKALLVIPMIVLDELDVLKNDEDEEKAFQARQIIRNISNYRAYDWLNTRESSHPELLSNDLDKERNDNKILSIAMRYCTKKPILLTDDINLGNIASANGVESMTIESYWAMKKDEQLSSKTSRKISKKKKK